MRETERETDKDKSREERKEIETETDGRLQTTEKHKRIERMSW